MATKILFKLRPPGPVCNNVEIYTIIYLHSGKRWNVLKKTEHYFVKKCRVLFFNWFLHQKMHRWVVGNIACLYAKFCTKYHNNKIRKLNKKLHTLLAKIFIVRNDFAPLRNHHRTIEITYSYNFHHFFNKAISSAGVKFLISFSKYSTVNLFTVSQ